MSQKDILSYLNDMRGVINDIKEAMDVVQTLMDFLFEFRLSLDDILGELALASYELAAYSIPKPPACEADLGGADDSEPSESAEPGEKPVEEEEEESAEEEYETVELFKAHTISD